MNASLRFRFTHDGRLHGCVREKGCIGNVAVTLVLFSLTKFCLHRPGLGATLDNANAQEARLNSRQLQQQVERGTAVLNNPNSLVTPPPRRNESTMSTIKTTVPHPSEIKAKQDGTITNGLKLPTWHAVLTELQNVYTDLNGRMDELTNQTTLNASLNTQVTQKDALIGQLNGRCQEHQKTIGDHEKTIQTQQAGIGKLEKHIEELRHALEDARNSLRDAGRHSALEQDEGVKKALAYHVKDYVFRTVKFARGDKLEEVTRGIYGVIGPLMGITDEKVTDSYVSEDEFCRIYTSCVTSELNKRRQYVQTRLLDAFQSKFSRSRKCAALELCS